MTEAQLLDAVLDAAATFGWRSFHARPARTNSGWRTPVQGNGQGFVDLVLARRGRVVFAELKSEKGTMTKDQEAWFVALSARDQEVWVWRPSDWHSGRIVEALR